MIDKEMIDAQKEVEAPALAVLIPVLVLGVDVDGLAGLDGFPECHARPPF